MKTMTIEEMYKEILRLRSSPYVSLAIHADKVHGELAERLVQLRELELRGAYMEQNGITEDKLNEILQDSFFEEEL